MDPFPLPAELLDPIVYYVYKGRDLYSCRLLSRAFNQAASRLLYQSISITLHSPPIYTNKRCEVLNDMLQRKPHILNWIRSLNVNLTMGFGPRMWGYEAPEDYVVLDSHSFDHQEVTELLLTMTHAPRMEELVVRKDRGDNLPLRHIAQDIMTALVALRFMPSLRRLQLIGLQDPPVALVIGHPGLDGVISPSVNRGTFIIEKSEANCKGLGIPTQGPLSTSFRNARVDWDSVFRVQSHLNTFNLTETPPFHAVTHADLYPILPFYEYLQEVHQRMGGRQPAFARLKVLHYRTFSALADDIYGDLDRPDLHDSRQMVADECANIEKLIVNIAIDLLAFG